VAGVTVNTHTAKINFDVLITEVRLLLPSDMQEFKNKAEEAIKANVPPSTLLPKAREKT
jgi:hypothetical protein